MKIENVLPYVIAAVLPIITWFMGRKKERANLESQELMNFEKAVSIWKTLASDMEQEMLKWKGISEQLKEELEKLKGEVETLREENNRMIHELERLTKLLNKRARNAD